MREDSLDFFHDPAIDFLLLGFKVNKGHWFG